MNEHGKDSLFARVSVYFVEESQSNALQILTSL